MKQKSEQETYLTVAALCAQAEHCQWEMLEKMRRWELSEEQQAHVMQRLLEERYVDDERYARAFIKDKIRYNRWGRRKVEQALWQKHIAEDIRLRALDEVDDEEYLSVLRPLLKQKQQELKKSKGQGTRGKEQGARGMEEALLNQKLIRFALGRGFTYDLIRQCVDDVED